MPELLDRRLVGAIRTGWSARAGGRGKIRADTESALVSPEARTLFATNTFQLVRKTPEQFVQFIGDDLDNWARQIKAAGIQPD